MNLDELDYEFYQRKYRAYLRLQHRRFSAEIAEAIAFCYKEMERIAYKEARHGR